MNKRTQRGLSPILVIVGLIVASSPSSGIEIIGGPLDGTDVGSPDAYTAYTTSLANSSPATETNWVNSILTGTTYEVKTEDVDIYGTDATNTFAFELDGTPSYFIVKNTNAWVLFANNIDIDYGVVDVDDLVTQTGMSFNIGNDTQISHVTEFSGGPGPGPEPGPVPAPAPLALFGLGGLMLGWSMRRKSRA